MLNLKKFIVWSARYSEIIISGTAFCLMITMTCLNVFTRNLFDLSIHASAELSYLGFCYAMFFGASLLYRQHGLISVSVIFDRLSNKTRYWVCLFNFCVLFLGNMYACYLSLLLALSGLTRFSPFLKIPYFADALAPTIAFGLMAIYSARFAIIIITKQGDAIIQRSTDATSTV